MQFTTVKRAVRAVHVDGADKDRAPEVEQVHGEVTFYPMMGEGDSVQVQTVDGPVTVVLTPITVRISDGLVMHRGGVGVQLFAGGKGSEPSLIRWRAVFRGLQSQGVPLTLRDVIFDAIPGGEVDLTTATPLANAPEPIVRGPQGVSVDTIVVEGGDLVVWGRSESGRQILSRIKMSEITEPAAQAAADDTLAKLKTTLDGKADKTATTQALATKADQEATTQALAGKASKAHTHLSKDVTDARSAPTAGVLVKYDTAGLFTVGVPTAAAHPATKKYVDDGLAKKADASHTHTIGNVTGLQAALDAKATTTALTEGLAGKSDTTHSHSWAQVTGKPSAFPPASHKHDQGDITGLSTTLSGKADKTHSHSITQVTGLQSALDQKVAKTALTHIKHDPTPYDPNKPFNEYGATGAGLDEFITPYPKTLGVWAAAIGTQAYAAGDLAVAVGSWSIASKNWSTAIGNMARADAEGAVAIGSATARGENSIAIGGSTNSANTIQLGGSNYTVKVDGDLQITAPTTASSAATRKYVDEKKYPISHITGLAGEIGARPNGWIIETTAELAATEKKARPGDIIHVVETNENWKVS